MELTIEKTYPDAAAVFPTWHQAYLILGESKQEIGRAYFDYDDCRLNCEKIVKEFSKQGVQIIHSKIYDLAP